MTDRFVRLAEQAEMVARIVSLKDERAKLLEEAREYREKAALAASNTWAPWREPETRAAQDVRSEAVRPMVAAEIPNRG